jgi:hypothetical protein
VGTDVGFRGQNLMLLGSELRDQGSAFKDWGKRIGVSSLVPRLGVCVK